MAKLTQAQKEDFRIARAALATFNARVFFSRSIGMMLAIMPTPSEHKHEQIIFDITVALCHHNDEFKKKLGLIQLYDNYDNGRNMLMRIEYKHNTFYDFAQRLFNYEPFEEMELN